MAPVDNAPAREKTARILLVEDNSGDEFLFVDAFERARTSHRLEIVRDGEAALDRLRGEGDFEGSAAPDLVLLDLNLPRIDGREILRTVKNDARLRRIPILVLTTSSSEEDLHYCYSEHANAYMTKPFEARRYEEMIAAVDAFWFSTARLPGEAVRERRY